MAMTGSFRIAPCSASHAACKLPASITYVLHQFYNAPMAHVISLVGEQVPMSVTSALPAGSVTKPWTAVRVVQLAAVGALGPLGLDTPVHAVVDPWLARQVPPAPSLSTIWAGHPQIKDVTVRQVASMAAGFRDYDDFALQCVHSHELECIGMTPPHSLLFSPLRYSGVLL